MRIIRSWCASLTRLLRSFCAFLVVFAGVVVVLLFAITLCWVYLAFNFSEDDGPENISLTHMDLSHIQRWLAPLHSLTIQSPWMCVAIYSLVFTLKTMTCLPGASVLVVLAGALWSWSFAVGLSLLLVTLGSFASFLISAALLHSPLQEVSKVFGSSTLTKLQEQIDTVSNQPSGRQVRADVSRLLRCGCRHGRKIDCAGQCWRCDSSLQLQDVS